MNYVLPLAEIGSETHARVGGKAWALARMLQHGSTVPDGVCILTDAYHEYVRRTGLQTGILMALNRKNLEGARWEELWDTALHIRALFRKTPLPTELRRALAAVLAPYIDGKPVAVRSSSPGEDDAQSSFAGLHASYLNVIGMEAVLDRTRAVWASLWSDAALLYRRELKLDVAKSAMAVVIQELQAGEKSGVAFGMNPNDPSQCIIEAVHGLNQGLEDGTLDPDRWILERDSGRQLSHTAATRSHAVALNAQGVGVEPLPPALRKKAPLTNGEVCAVYDSVREMERLFGSPQDMEWTWCGHRLDLLQSRPITTLASKDPKDPRGWYLSLRRSFANLKHLREQIETIHIPALIEEAQELAQRDLSTLRDTALEAECRRRAEIYSKWHRIYWDDFIPFAHGMRLFGVAYNEALQPSDPFEFMEVLVQGDLESLARNRLLDQMAARVRSDAALATQLSAGESGNPEFQTSLKRFHEKYGGLLSGGSDPAKGSDPVVRLVLEMAKGPPRTPARAGQNKQVLEARFLAEYGNGKRLEAEELLDLARASYRLRDDDNIYLGRVKAELLRAQEALQQRRGTAAPLADGVPGEIDRLNALRNPAETREARASGVRESLDFRMATRQIVGHPAGPGIATGRARVIEKVSDLVDVKAGEILVCDAVDPNMTFVIPLAAGIVERRGGMLIHGAIIAREYGLPCVTGVADATNIVRTGDRVTVDGYLGIVIIGEATLRPISAG